MTDWESCYLEGTTPWDKGAPSPPLSWWLQEHKGGLAGKALVPGCGIGHDVAHLIQHGLDAHGVDLSPTAVDRARAAYPQWADRFHLGDLFALPSDWAGSFDFVVEHTCLCALPPEWRAAYAGTVFSLLKPGGYLAGVWFINPEMDPGENGPPFGISTEELDRLFPDGPWEIVMDEVPPVAYEGREGRERVRVLRKRS